MILLESDSHPGFIYKIIQADHWLFSKINQDWASRTTDLIFPFLREMEFWMPLYLFLLVIVLYNFGIKALRWVLMFIVTVAIGDQVSSNLVKSLVTRIRPCRNPELADNIRVLVHYCPQSSSFTSSHACNHFAMAWFIFLTLRHTGKWWGVVFVWAALVAYAQVYVGVHFPIDVAGGALLGTLIGILTSSIFRWQAGTLNLQAYNHQHV